MNLKRARSVSPGLGKRRKGGCRTRRLSTKGGDCNQASRRRETTILEVGGHDDQPREIHDKELHIRALV